MKLLMISVATAGIMFAQAQTEPSSKVITLDRTPIYKVTVVSKTAKAINYRHRSGATKVNFGGTALMPKARGEAKVESKKGYIEVEVEFDNLSAPTSWGPEYLTYVLWAISPEGRAQNLGEILLDSQNRGKLNVTTEFQTFGMIVTAEPYFAVTQPSDVVVMENVVRGDTKGAVEEIDARYELLQRGQYTFNADQKDLRSFSADQKKFPIDIYEAENAVRISRWAGADKYATESFGKAEDLLKRSLDYQTRKERKPASMMARQATQTAHDAREIALKRIEQEKLEQERIAAAEREAAEKAKAEESARLRVQAEEQQRAEAQRRAAAEENARMETQRRAQADAERIAAEKAKAEAQAAQLVAANERAAAEAARAAALQAQTAAQAEADKARAAAGEADRLRLAAEQDKERLRQQLLQQLNMILETRDSARGLIVNMSDVLFDTAKYTLRPAAREKLARISGIVLGHPSLKLEVEGHTDSVGSDSYNQRLSEQRADSVRQYLTSQGLPSNNVTSKGFGETMPVASNDNAAGRQQNRRVELVVSGEAIGTKISEMKGTIQPPQPR